MLFVDNRVGQFERFKFFDDDVGDDHAGESFIVGRDDVPGS